MGSFLCGLSAGALPMARHFIRPDEESKQTIVFFDKRVYFGVFGVGRYDG
jgi:hypothetical protein